MTFVCSASVLFPWFSLSLLSLCEAFLDMIFVMHDYSGRFGEHVHIFLQRE
eukprot:m.45470 g.45470  ORF g.45470 m.45470 type:complete len:51 (-) comp12179_c0_seq7:351-503(-)